MSLNEDKRLEQKALKPFLILDIGNTVFLKSDTKKEYPMIITDFNLDDDCCNDYRVKWFDSKGIMQRDSLPEECLTTEVNNK